ncbi:hypothetical protein BH09SUM1_BH09SUM1_30630 [soil metagenome]
MAAARKILIIEDSATDSAILSHFVRSNDLGEPTVVKDGLEGLNACFRDRPDVLVLDLELPTMRGEEICRLIRASESLRKTPIVVVSELPDAKRREMELLLIGADVYLQKPFDQAAFVGALRRILQTSEDPPTFVQPAEEKAGPDYPAQALWAALDTKEIESDIKPAAKGDLSPPTPPRVFEGYEIHGIVGAGGMGTVYKAEQLSLKRIVALKVMKESVTNFKRGFDRFVREARIMAQINHPNIVQVFDIGKTDYRSYFSMEFVEGDSLFSIIENKALSWKQIYEIIEQICDAIGYLHSRDIIHRDIKPSNILVSNEGRVKITDFGISRALLPHETSLDLSQEKAVMGTLTFIAPELMDGSAQPNSSTDQYALAMTFWQLFTRLPAKKDPEPISLLRPEFPATISRVIERGTSSDAAQRYESIREFKHMLLNAIIPYMRA